MTTISLLPIGSIVLLDHDKKKLMIYGRKQRMKSGQIFDYLGCLYPEGFINPAYSFVFNHNQIKEVIFQGYSNEEETKFVNEILELFEEKQNNTIS